MYGLIGQMTAVPGQRDALIAILIEGVRDMPGCLSYVVARDPGDGRRIWWDRAVVSRRSDTHPNVECSRRWAADRNERPLS